MHCPQCGQKQVSDEMRFCSGCGFALAAVKELLTTGGISPTGTDSNKPEISPRRRGVRQGAILIFIAMAILPLLAALGEQWSEVVPASIMMAGLMRILYAAIFQEGARSRDAQRRALSQASPNRIELGRASDRVLPAAQGVPVTDFQASRGITKEMAGPPPSVTEHTTKLLNDSKDHE